MESAHIVTTSPCAVSIVPSVTILMTRATGVSDSVCGHGRTGINASMAHGDRNPSGQENPLRGLVCYVRACSSVERLSSTAGTSIPPATYSQARHSVPMQPAMERILPAHTRIAVHAGASCPSTCRSMAPEMGIPICCRPQRPSSCTVVNIPGSSTSHPPTSCSVTSHICG